MSHERRIFYKIEKKLLLNGLPLEITLPPEESNYLSRVLRMRIGYVLILVDLHTTLEYEAEITEIKKSVTIRLLRTRPKRAPSETKTTLILGLCKNQTTEFILEKATELGVSEILVVKTTNSVPVYREEKELNHKLVRWNKIVEAASAQSARIDIPQIDYLNEFNEELFSNLEEKSLKFHCSLELESVPLLELLTTSLKQDRFKQIYLAIGPEGDFTPLENKILSKFNFKKTSLGKNRLRSETATITALSGVFLALEMKKG